MRSLRPQHRPDGWGRRPQPQAAGGPAAGGVGRGEQQDDRGCHPVGVDSRAADDRQSETQLSLPARCDGGRLARVQHSHRHATPPQVLAAGPGKRSENGEVQAVGVPAGASVLYSKYSGVEFEGKDGAGYIVIREGDILAVLS